MPSYTTNPCFSSKASNTNFNDDPKSIIHQMLMAKDLKNVPVEDAFLAWILSLPNELDPAQSAQRLLLRYENEAKNTNEDAFKTIDILKQTAEYPRSRLASSGRRNKGRRKLHS